MHGIPLFLTQLGQILEQEAALVAADGSEMRVSAILHGGELLQQGFSVAQVVHDYGDLCQAITELALELELPIGTEDFHTLNRCLDNAIASAVTEYARQRDVDMSEAEVNRHAFFAHELRNHLQTAMLAFQAVKSGKVGVTGSTIDVLDKALSGLRDLIDGSVSEVRLNTGMGRKERIRVSDLIEETEIHASMEAADRGLHFGVERVDNTLQVDVDRQLFTSAISNLLRNAFKFTRPSSHVQLRAVHRTDRISIEVEDECGGLPPGAAEKLFKPFQQWGVDRSGLGLGLAITRRAIEMDGGRVSIRDIPGKGCVFIVDMPLAVGRRAGD
ncbi:MAG TPA: HAMP domain-containing sensor histidine kinase [Dehalococcoidia bacterium]|jgi:signal transduction histidine kinase|nr:HAMP domain-containing sensor histidine kinase [Dehalococcoidia bacterium]